MNNSNIMPIQRKRERSLSESAIGNGPGATFIEAAETARLDIDLPRDFDDLASNILCGETLGMVSF